MNMEKVFVVFNADDDSEVIYAGNREERFNRFVELMKTKYPHVPIEPVTYNYEDMDKNFYNMLTENFEIEFE